MVFYSKFLLKQKMGRYSIIRFSAFIPQDIIFGKSKPYLRRQRDSGSSLVAWHVCTTWNCLSEKCHSQCFHPPARSEPSYCSGSHSMPCRSLEGEKARNASKRNAFFSPTLLLEESSLIHVTIMLWSQRTLGRDRASSTPMGHFQICTPSQWLHLD